MNLISIVFNGTTRHHLISYIMISAILFGSYFLMHELEMTSQPVSHPLWQGYISTPLRHYICHITFILSESYKMSSRKFRCVHYRPPTFLASPLAVVDSFFAASGVYTPEFLDLYPAPNLVPSSNNAISLCNNLPFLIFGSKYWNLRYYTPVFRKTGV